MGAKQSKIIAAIDFGTAYSGFAFMFTEDEEHIFTASHGTILPEDRVPTVVLLYPDDTFKSFGIEAEDDYSVLALKGKHRDYRLFREFKMALYTKDERLKSDIQIYDTERRPKKAIDVFAIVIRHLKSLAIESMKLSKVGNKPFKEEIDWILTIPAIWSDSSRQFMRQAAIEAGISVNKLRLVLEPEAAALFSNNQLLRATYDGNLTHLQKGTKYILADLGGGTADICVHEILRKGQIRELYRADGGPFGGTIVNLAFVQFLIKIIGAPTWKKIKESRCFDYLRMLREFETQKNKFDNTLTDFVVDLPSSLVRMVETDVGSDLATVLAQSGLSSLVQLKDNKLICDRKIMEDFFKPSIEGIVKTLHTVFKECEKDCLRTLLVAGGFAESQYLRDCIKNEMTEKEVVLVQEPRLAVLKGAVKMGLKPNSITERRSRYTYGFCVAEPFQEGKHPEFLKFERDGKYLCDKVFSKTITKDSILKCNQEFRIKLYEKLTYPTSNDIKLVITMYRTTKLDPLYCLESNDCVDVGEIVVEPPQEGWNNYYDIDLILIVGETEFKVKAFDTVSERNFKAYINFM